MQAADLHARISVEGIGTANRDLASFGGAVDKTADSANKSGSAIGKLGPIIAGVGAAAVAGFGALAASSVSMASNFESSLSGIKSVSGATAGEMKQISDLALKLGADTAFSASEAADGLSELIKGGLSIPDAMAASAATLNLAAAGELGVADAAAIASNAIGIFSLKGSDMENVANQIAGAANASSLSVQDFQQSLASSGSVAAGVGQSFNDLATAIAVMGKSGIKGSDAGTSLKTMLLNLQPTTKGQIATFEQLGITHLNTAKAMEILAKNGIKPVSQESGALANQLQQLFISQGAMTGSLKQQQGQWEDIKGELGLVTNEFVNADGSFKSMSQVAEILQKSTSGLTSSQRALALETMFGTDAIRAANIFVKEGAKGFDDMAASMGKVTAADVAATRLDNLKGSFDAMKGSIETFQIVIGTALLPVLTSLIRDGLTPIINTATTFAQSILSAADPMAALVSAVNGIIPGFSTLVSVMTAVVAGFGDGGIGGAISALLPILATVGAQFLTMVPPELQGLVAALGVAFSQVGGILANVATWAMSTATALGPGALAGAATIAHDTLITLVNALTAVITATTTVVSWVQQHTAAQAVLVGGLTAVTAAILLVQGATLATTIATMATTAATTAYTAGQWLLNAALTANPIGIVVVALAALAAGLIYAYNNSETFRTAVNSVAVVLAGAFNDAMRGAQAVAGALSASFASVSNAISGVINWVNNLAGKLASIKMPDWLVQHSPSEFEQSLMDVGAEMRNLYDKHIPALQGAMNALKPADLASTFTMQTLGKKPLLGTRTGGGTPGTSEGSVSGGRVTSDILSGMTPISGSYTGGNNLASNVQPSNTFNLTINSSAKTEQVVDSFNLMKAWAGQ